MILCAITVVLLSPYILLESISFRLHAQTLSSQNLGTYEKRSNFIEEFEVPINDRGLKGIVTDSDQNVWFYHATNKSSTIMKMSLEASNFTAYNVPGSTTSDNAIINLAGGQLLFDNISNVIWFTDARINSLGKLDIQTSRMELFSIPTKNSGIMGITLSPDRKFIWFTEITGNKLGSLDIENKNINEYPTGDATGPTLLTFDSNGVLWVTLSYANSILRVEPWLLIPGSLSTGMYSISLGKYDSFSPFGIVTVLVQGTEKIFLSDHGSSRLIAANVNSDLKNYISYWTSPSTALPMSLPSQVVSDRAGNIFSVEHGGNKLVKISPDNWMMTEFDIPTGPLSTSVFLTASGDSKRIWFTEWASNKIGYLDNSVGVPLTIGTTNNESNSNNPYLRPIVLHQGQNSSVNISLTLNKNLTSLVMANNTQLSVVGMTDTGLQGVIYTSHPQRVNLIKIPEQDVKLDIKAGEKAISGNYTIMIRASVLEKDSLILSFLYPILVKLDVASNPSEINKIQNFQNFPSKNAESDSSVVLLRDLMRLGAISAAVILIIYLVYQKIIRKIKFKKLNRKG